MLKFDPSCYDRFFEIEFDVELKLINCCHYKTTIVGYLTLDVRSGTSRYRLIILYGEIAYKTTIIASELIQSQFFKQLSTFYQFLKQLSIFCQILNTCFETTTNCAELEGKDVIFPILFPPK